jgi:signal transduction histidine kinase
MRTTLAALLVVGVAMVVGGVMLVAVLRNALTGEVRDSARLRATEVAADLESGTRPHELAVGEAEDLLIQVLDERGEVVRSSRNVQGLPPVARLRPEASAKVDVPIDNDDFLAVAVAATTPQGRLTVVVARVADMVGESTRIVTVLLAVGLPVLLLVVAATTWKVVGWALAPVEAIRGEVDEISAVELHRRVPDPPGDDEVARLARTMNRMLGRLQRAHQRQRRFVADASHELRSPVASIRQHAEVALAHPGRTTTAELAATVLAEDLRIQRLVEDLLLLARADERALPARRRHVDLDDLVFDEARRLRDGTGLHIAVGAASATTPPVTPASGSASGSVSGTARRSWRWTTTGPGSPRPTASASWSGSSASTTPAPATPVAAGSAWPSSRSWWRPTVARSASPAAPLAAPASRSASRAPSASVGASSVTRRVVNRT